MKYLCNSGRIVLKFQSEQVRKLIREMHKLSNETDVLGKYGVDKYLSAFGLNVHPNFRKQGLGEELLRTRSDFIKCCANLFTDNYLM